MSHGCPETTFQGMTKRIKFTSARIKSLPSAKKDRDNYTDSVIPSLELRVGKSGKKTFNYRFKENGISKRKKIGEFPNLTISEARRKARLFEFQKNLEEPQKIITSKLSLQDVYDSYELNHLPKLKETTSIDYQNRLKKYVLPKLGDEEIEEITSPMVHSLLNKIASKTPTTANRVKAILSSLFTYSVNNNLCSSNPVNNIPMIHKEKPRDRIYSTEEMFSILNVIEKISEPLKSNLLLIIFTGQRVNEINSLKWSDILYDENKIIIRGVNTKNSHTQVLPIIPSIKIVLDSIKKYSFNISEYLFPVEPDFKNHRKSMSSIIKKIKKDSGVDDFRLHDIRSKLTTVLSEKGIDRITVGKLLNHKQMAGDNSVTGYHYDSYDYFKQKRDAIDIWNKYLIEEVLKKGYINEKLGKFFNYES